MPSSAHIFETVLFFLRRERKERFQSSKKRKRASANRCPEFDSENLRLKLSVTPDPTTRKVSALCASPFGGAAQQDQHLRADESPQGAGRICNAPSSRTAALGIGPCGVRRGQLIALPPGRRKLHIRWLLLPFQTVTAALGHSLG